MRTNSKTFTSLNSTIQGIQTEGIMGAVKRTAERVVNKVSSGRWETNADAKKRQRDRWAREDSAKAAREKEARRRGWEEDQKQAIRDDEARARARDARNAAERKANRDADLEKVKWW